MNHPPYHLRPNKAVDRFLLVDMLMCLQRHISLEKYTYYGMGGPFLEDCRLLRQYFPSLSLVSIERDEHTVKRQKFHQFTRNIKILHCSVRDFLTEYKSEGREIIWLDYTGLSKECFREFGQLLQKAEPGTIAKLTLRAQREGNPYQMRPPAAGTELDAQLAAFQKEFWTEFAEVRPSFVSTTDFRPGEFASLLQRMVRVAAERALPETAGGVFCPLHSVSYNDGTRMLSVAGAIWRADQAGTIRDAIHGWPFADLTWGPPQKVDMPILSVKERLRLESLLPGGSGIGGELSRELGYSIAGDMERTRDSLEQYARFHRYYPLFAKVTL